MKNEKLKDCLDDALSGIGENPWLLRQVLARAESEENKPVKRKISFGTVLIAILLVLVMSAGVAAVTQWNVLDFLQEWGKDAAVTPAPVGQEAETEHARLRVDSAFYDGGVLAFDLTLENKDPSVPVYCWVETFTVNGKAYEPGIIEHAGANMWSVCDFNEHWLPGDEYPEGIARCGELLSLDPDGAGEENARVEMKVNVYRPNRPVALVNTDSGNSYREEVERKIAEGYFVISASSWGGEELYPDGFVMPEEDLDACPEGWSVAVSGVPPVEATEMMGGMTTETLEICFNTEKTENTGWNRKLIPQESYENEYCTAVYDQADLSLMGMYLTLRITPKEEGLELTRNGHLTDGEGNALKLYPMEMNEYSPPDHPEEIVRSYRWFKINPEELPDLISLTCRLKNGEDMVFPVKVGD